jgi:hypothetical protein
LMSDDAAGWFPHENNKLLEKGSEFLGRGLVAFERCGVGWWGEWVRVRVKERREED